MEQLMLVTFAVLLGVIIPGANAKYAEGHMRTGTDWEFITRFCFLSTDGTLKFSFTYPVSYGPQSILLYFDTAYQWESVYKTGKTCDEKISVLNPANNQIINLTTAYSLSGCLVQDIGGIANYVCSGGRTFRSARERWWFIAVSRCYQNDEVKGIDLKYSIHMTNGDSFNKREYSADEFYIFPIAIITLALYVVLTVAVIIFAVKLHRRQLLHTTYKLYMVSVFLWTSYLFLFSIAYGVYGNDGLPDKLSTTKYAARAFEAVSMMVFLLMLILIGKGYTITRGRLSNLTTIIITVFFSLYTVAYIVMFIWEAIWFDPGLVLYLYESPPGYGLIGLRLLGWLWFAYAIFFTVKHYPEKGMFYYPLFVFYTLWFWAGPIVIIVAMFSIALWSREKTVVGVECFVGLCGHVFFLVLTRPSAANSNFPYHVRTTQIGIMQNVPQGLQNGLTQGIEGHAENFSHHPYSTSPNTMSPSTGPNLTGMFVTSQERSDTPVSETTFNNKTDNKNVSIGLREVRENGVQERSEQNGVHLPPIRNEVHAETMVPSAPPPDYEAMFRA